MKRVISFSLWGTNPKYTLGMIENAKLAKIFYPAWECWCFCGQSVPSDIVQMLLEQDVKIIHMSELGDHQGKFWRFYPIANTSVNCVIMRDSDSRLSEREANAVEEWLKTSAKGHIMRDHPCHVELILAGMWGVRDNIIPNMKDLINNFVPKDEYNSDQIFLAEVIYPMLLQHGLCVHASYSQYEKDFKVFPSPRTHYHFVGEVFDEKNCRENAWKRICFLERKIFDAVFYKIFAYEMISNTRHKLALLCKRTPFGTAVWSMLRKLFKLTWIK